MKVTVANDKDDTVTNITVDLPADGVLVIFPDGFGYVVENWHNTPNDVFLVRNDRI